jgi:hypothetical protein
MLAHNAAAVTAAICHEVLLPLFMMVSRLRQPLAGLGVTIRVDL